MAFWAGAYLYLLNIIFTLYGRSLGFNIWGDKDWYLNAGRSLLSGDFSIEFILFSPFHSLLLAINDWFAEAVGIDSSLTAFLTRAPFLHFLWVYYLSIYTLFDKFILNKC